MNKTIEAIKAGNKVTTEELFEIVNAYVLTRLSLWTPDGNKVMAMEVNRYERLHSDYSFLQECTWFDEAMYLLNADELVSTEAEYNSKADTVSITCKLKNGMELLLTVICIAGNEIEKEGIHEVDMYSIQEFLEDVMNDKNVYYCSMVKITDAFGFELDMHPKHTYINTSDDSDWKLHIDDDINVFEVPVADDSINLFYMKDTDNLKQIIMKPYGQPFMEIRMIFFKKHE